MPGGLETEIGERGTTLSGGQKQRLAIARAVYSSPALLVVDDALAAVDGRVAAAIWRNVFIARREVGLATVVALNQLQLVPDADSVVFLDAGLASAQARLFLFSCVVFHGRAPSASRCVW